MSLIDITKNLHDDQDNDLIKSDIPIQLIKTLLSNGSTFELDSSGNLFIKNKENANIYFFTNNTRRAVIDSQGFVGIGDMNNSLFNFSVNGSSYANRVLAAFINTNAVNGYGVFIKNSVNVNYSLVIVDSNDIGIFTVYGTGEVVAKHSFNVSNKIRTFYDSATGERGTQIKLINKTGSNTVKGSLVRPSTTTKAGFQLVTNQYDSCNVVYEAGIADGAEAWIWCINSVCEMLFALDIQVNAGDLIIASSTAGFAERIAPPPPPPTNDTHFKEVGHAQETKISTSNFLCLVNFHTN